jgi:outer membrane protein assembly factor BamB
LLTEKKALAMASTRITTREITVWKAIILLLSVLALLSLSACGRTLGTPAHSPFSNVPTGTGNNPEPGTNGEPQVSPTGHSESILTGDNVAFVGSDNGKLYAFNATSGKVEWQRLLGGPVFVNTVAGGVVYASTNASSSTSSGIGTGSVYAVSSASGQVLWQFSRPSTDVVSVMVSDGMVLVGTGSQGNQDTIFALDASSGRVLWERTEATSIPGLLGAAGGIVYTAEASSPDPFGRSTLVALDAGTGRILWQLTLQQNDGFPGGLPAESTGVLYMETSDGAVYALSASTGAVLWHAPASQPMGEPPAPPVPVSPVMANGFVYAGSTTGVTAYRAADGTVVWHYQDRAIGPFLPQPVLVSGVIYVNAGTQVAALRVGDGTVLWKSPAAGGLDGPMLVTDGVVISNGGTVFALRASDGGQIWQSTFVPEGSRMAGPVGLPVAVGTSSAGGVVCIGSDDGVVHALRASDGNQLWHYAIPELPVPLLMPVFNAAVTFTPSTTFSQALEAVTNLGLKTYLLCTPGWTNLSSLQASFPTDHNLTVEATVASAPVWFDRLKALPIVATSQPNVFASCPLEQPSNGPAPLSQQQAGAYLKAIFSGNTSYDTALEGIDGLGFRLAVPCYEQKRAKGDRPTWQPLSEQGVFSQSHHSLVLATTTENSTIWLQQLQSLSGVQTVTSPFTASC